MQISFNSKHSENISSGVRIGDFFIAISWKPIFNNWKCSVINDMHKMVTE